MVAISISDYFYLNYEDVDIPSGKFLTRIVRETAFVDVTTAFLPLFEPKTDNRLDIFSQLRRNK